MEAHRGTERVRTMWRPQHLVVADGATICRQLETMETMDSDVLTSH